MPWKFSAYRFDKWIEAVVWYNKYTLGLIKEYLRNGVEMEVKPYLLLA